MALEGLKVLEIAGLAPAPFAGLRPPLSLFPPDLPHLNLFLFVLPLPVAARRLTETGMILADFGATVVRVDRTEGMNSDNLSRSGHLFHLGTNGFFTLHILHTPSISGERGRWRWTSRALRVARWF